MLQLQCELHVHYYAVFSPRIFQGMMGECGLDRLINTSKHLVSHHSHIKYAGENTAACIHVVL